MSWRIAADARETFFDLVAIAPDGKTGYLIRTLNRKDQLLSGLSEALGLVPGLTLDDARLWLTWDYERVCLREHWGSKAAFIATEGFENLLELGLQDRQSTFGLRSEKVQPFITRDFSFGLSERTLASGEIGKSLEESEIDAICSKLKLLEVKNVAVCLLHSPVNSANEKFLSQALKKNDFNVFCSFEENGSELERAKKVSAKAFLEAEKNELLQKIKNLGFKPENIFFKSERPAFNHNAEKTHSVYIEFLEDRILLTQNKKTSEIAVSPLSIVDLDAGALPHVGPERVDSEPGPMVFGKGLKLTAFDIFSNKSKLTASEIPRLKLDSVKVQRHLAPLAQNLRLDVETTTEKYLNLFFEMVTLEISRLLDERPQFMVAGGWLAPYFSGTIARKMGVHKVFVTPHPSHVACFQLLETEFSDKMEFVKVGQLQGQWPGLLEPGEVHDL
jgi:N-methylhydantoinase A/oxoprolinase/acetone carboxylase beta subunit